MSMLPALTNNLGAEKWAACASWPGAPLGSYKQANQSLVAIYSGWVGASNLLYYCLGLLGNWRPTATLVTHDSIQFEKEVLQIPDLRKITDPFRGILQNIPQFNEEKAGKESTCTNQFGLGTNTGILTDYVNPKVSPQVQYLIM